VLEKEASKYHFLHVLYGTKVTTLDYLNASNARDGQESFNVGVMMGGEESVLHCDRVIFATGSSRIGFDIVASLGHSIETPMPSLFSFKISDNRLTSLSGSSNKFTRVRLILPKETQSALAQSGAVVSPQSMSSLTQRGPLLITHAGVSGPAVLRLSAFAAKILFALRYKCIVEINWLGDMKIQELLIHFLQYKEEYPNRSIGRAFPTLSARLQQLVANELHADEFHFDSYTTLESSSLAAPDTCESNNENHGIMSRRIWQYLLERAGIAGDAKWSSIPNNLLQILVNQICHCRFDIAGRGLYRDEFVTCGGVSLREVNMDRMESKLIPGLYFAGEILDIDGITGGYNFQSAWTTGFLAGNSAGLSFR